MLMALGESVPERVFAHGFLNVRNSETGAIEDVKSRAAMPLRRRIS